MEMHDCLYCMILQIELQYVMVEMLFTKCVGEKLYSLDTCNTPCPGIRIPNIPLHPLQPSNIILTISKAYKSESHPYKPTWVRSACFVLTHMHPRKILKRPSNIELFQAKHI